MSPNDLIKEPTPAHMQLSPRQVVVEFAHLLQQDLFPVLQTVSGPLSRQMELLISVMSLAPLGRLLSARRGGTGRPAKDRAALAVAFMAKAILNIPTTRDLIGHIARDSTAIAVRERYPETEQQKAAKQEQKAKKPGGRRGRKKGSKRRLRQGQSGGAWDQDPASASPEAGSPVEGSPAAVRHRGQEEHQGP